MPVNVDDEACNVVQSPKRERIRVYSVSKERKREVREFIVHIIPSTVEKSDSDFVEAVTMS